MLTAEDKKRLKLMGLDKHGRSAFFRGKRKDVKGAHFTEHSCAICGGTFPCELRTCDHAVYVRVGPCCDPESGKRQ